MRFSFLSHIPKFQTYANALGLAKKVEKNTWAQLSSTFMYIKCDLKEIHEKSKEKQIVHTQNQNGTSPRSFQEKCSMVAENQKNEVCSYTHISDSKMHNSKEMNQNMVKEKEWKTREKKQKHQFRSLGNDQVFYTYRTDKGCLSISIQSLKIIKNLHEQYIITMIIY